MGTAGGVEVASIAGGVEVYTGGVEVYGTAGAREVVGVAGAGEAGHPHPKYWHQLNPPPWNCGAA